MDCEGECNIVNFGKDITTENMLNYIKPLYQGLHVKVHVLTYEWGAV